MAETLPARADDVDSTKLEQLLPESDVLRGPKLDSAPPITGGTNPGATLGQGVKALSDTDNLSAPSKNRAEQRLRQAVSGGTSAEISRMSRFSVSQPASGTLGMDVSGWQPIINWAAEYANGARFAYAKVSEGTGYVSPVYSSQASGAAAAGMYRGGYHFALPSQSSGAAQANAFVDNGGGWSADGRTLPGLLDIEYNPYGVLGDTCYNMYGSTMTNWIKDFAATYKARTGRYPAIYSNTDWLTTCGVQTSQINYLPLHVASYSGTSSPGVLPSGWTAYDIWQYSADGPFSGDSNLFAGTLADLRRFAIAADYAPLGAPRTAAASVQSGPVVRNGFAAFYAAHQGMITLGTPLYNERSGLVDGGVYQGFSRGTTLYWSPATGTHSVNFNGGIGQKYKSGGYENAYGYPVSEEFSNGALAYQWFRTASGTLSLFMWTPSTGTQVIVETHGIGAHWVSTGRENGAGVPTYDERSNGRGGVFQGFMRGGRGTTIVWSASTGAHSVYEPGAIASAWSRAGRETGSWGYPTTDEFKGSDGKVHQKFSGGVEAIWSPTSFAVVNQ